MKKNIKNIDFKNIPQIELNFDAVQRYKHVIVFYVIVFYELFFIATFVIFIIFNFLI